MLALAAAERFDDVVDIGCGRAQLGLALLEAGLARRVLGLDRHAGHLAQARRAAGGLAFSAALRDLAAAPHVPEAATVLLIDVLYQLDAAEQIALLLAAARAARERILVRTLDPDRGMRSALTTWLERCLRPISPHSGRHVTILPIARLAAALAGAGFEVSVAPCWQGTPFANVLITGRRASAAAHSRRTPAA
jgi:SAM-dependent methyltransferase